MYATVLDQAARSSNLSRAAAIAMPPGAASTAGRGHFEMESHCVELPDSAGGLFQMRRGFILSEGKIFDQSKCASRLGVATSAQGRLVFDIAGSLSHIGLRSVLSRRAVRRHVWYVEARDDISKRLSSSFVPSPLSQRGKMSWSRIFLPGQDGTSNSPDFSHTSIRHACCREGL